MFSRFLTQLLFLVIIAAALIADAQLMGNYNGLGYPSYGATVYSRPVVAAAPSHAYIFSEFTGNGF
jgi:hypothetical protein